MVSHIDPRNKIRQEFSANLTQLVINKHEGGANP